MRALVLRWTWKLDQLEVQISRNHETQAVKRPTELANQLGRSMWMPRSREKIVGQNSLICCLLFSSEPRGS
jgi:hypothetical protein